MSKPLVIDLFCGLGGWSEGFLAEGYDCIGFDIERHDYGTGGYPGQLVLQDVLTLCGCQFRKAAVIVASPPCQEYSYMAMPWKRAKQIAGALRGEVDFPEKYHGSRTTEELTRLFDACFRIAKDAGVPLVVENVKGAQPWVGPARAHYGSFYFWGDIESVGDRIVAGKLKFGEVLKAPTRSGGKANPDGTEHPQGSWFKVADSRNRGDGSKNDGGSWFAIANNTDSGHKQNPDGRKVPSMTGWDGYGKPGYKPQGFNVTAAQRYREENGQKVSTYSDRRRNGGKGARQTSPLENEKRFADGVKGMSGLHGMSHPDGNGKRDLGGPNDPRRYSSRSDSRKAASAQIAKIPFPLASYIARAFKP